MQRLDEILTWEQLCQKVMYEIKLDEKDHAAFRKWFMAREKLGYCFDYMLILRCFRIWQELRKGLDHFIVICGREGTGKSTLAIQIAAWIVPDGFEIRNITYTAKSYVELLHEKSRALEGNEEDNLKMGAIVMDEGTELLSRESLGVTNRVLLKSFFIQRALRFLVICNIPNFFMLDSAVRMHRCRTVIEVLSRGTYKCITGKGIQLLNEYGAKTKQIGYVKLPMGSFWHGAFNKHYPPMIEETAYKTHKMNCIREALSGMQDELIVTKLIPTTKIAKQIGSSDAKVIAAIKRGEIDGKRIGGRYYLTREAADRLFTPDVKS